MPTIFDSPARAVDMQGRMGGVNGGIGGPGGYEPTPEERQKQQEVFLAYQEAKKFRRSFDKDWERWYKLYAGQHWDQTRPEWKSTPVVNFIFSTIETIIPIMTDSSPQITCAPSEPDLAETAEVIGDCIKRVWVNNDCDLKLPIVLKNALKYGTSFMKAWWNQNADDGNGDIELSIVDPRHIFPSPGALDIQDAGYFIFAANVPVAYVCKLYPEAKNKVTAGVWEEDLTVQKTITAQSGGYGAAVVGPVQSTDSTGGSPGSSTSWASTPTPSMPTIDRSKICTLIEMWHRDPETDRVMLTVCANGVVLRDGESPFKHNFYPFVKFIDYAIPSSFWGMGEVQQLERLQDFINKRRGQTQDILRICGNPPLVADSTSGINPKAMTTRPGTIIYKNPGSDVHWLQPPQLPAALFQVQELDKEDFDSVSGIHDVTQGRKPAGIEAASAINELQEAAQTRLRLKVRNMEGSLRALGKLIVSLIQEFYTTERIVRLVGGNPLKPSFVVINQDIVDNMGNHVRINDVTVGKYDIEIGVGSTMPVNKNRRYKELVEMYQLQIVDGQAVLENSTLSPTEQARIAMRMQQLQQQMAAQQGSPPPATGSSPSNGASGNEPTEAELQALEQQG